MSSNNVNVLPKNFGTCAFCQMDFADVYRCPKCKQLFCNLKCYRSAKHANCSEDFYKTQVQQHIDFMRKEETDSDDEEPVQSSSSSKQEAKAENSPNKQEAKAESSSKKQKAKDEDKGRLTFEQYMEKHKKTDARKMEEEINPQIPIGPDEELVIDPDDDPEYLQDVLSEAVKDFEHMDEAEIDKRLNEMNIDINDEEQLLKKLTPEELKAFRQLTEEMFEIPQQSCFK